MFIKWEVKYLTRDSQLVSMDQSVSSSEGIVIMRLLVLIFITLCLSACAKSPPPVPSTTENASLALAEAANSVNSSLIQLDATEQAANPPLSIATPPSPASYGMAIPASLDWTGPAEQAITEIANAANYKLSILGPEPSMPIIVSVHQHNSTLGDILRNIGLQCGHRAQVVIYPKTKTIELRYIESS